MRSFLLLSLGQLAEHFEIAALADDDDRAVFLDDLRRARRGVQLAAGQLVADHVDAVVVVQIDLLEGFADERRLVAHQVLGDPEVEVARVAQLVEVLLEFGFGQEIGHALARRAVEHHHLFRARPAELALRFVAVRPGDDVEVRLEIPRGQHDEDVFGVVAGGGDQPLGAVQSRVGQHLFVRRVALDGEEPLVAGAKHVVDHVVDDDEGDRLDAQLLGDASSEAAVTADDEMAVQFPKHAFILLLFPVRPPFAGEQEDGDVGQGEEKEAGAADDEQHRENLSGVRERMDFVKADRRHRDDRHVEAVERGHLLDRHIPDGAGEYQERDTDKEDPEPAQGGELLRLFSQWR